MIALREIAEETITSERLKNDLIEEYQSNVLFEDEEINELEDNSHENISQANETSMEEKEDNTIDDPTRDAITMEEPSDNLEILSNEDKVSDL